ncbi:hypothetical protein [Microbacterium sp. KR10-403]|uniref:hypothetical protein n=1 Tax=Microbacterium sp. KR10-403 TaxID=3158581 RepID=UPI0032E3C14B
MTGLRAGAGRAEIAPGSLPLDGFTRVRDALAVRVLLVDDRAARIAWVVADQTALRPPVLEAVRARVCDAAGVAARDCLVSVSHTFSAPHIPEDDAPASIAWRAALCDAAGDAARQAAASLRPAAVAVGRVTCALAVNRDVEVAEGWTLGPDGTGFSDTTVHVVRVTDADETPIALLVGTAVQPSAMDLSGERVVSGDLAGAAMTRIEQALPGAVALSLIGCAGDQAPLGSGPAAVDALGERLAAVVLAADVAPAGAGAPLSLTAHELTVPGQVPTDRADIRPVRGHTFTTAADRPLPFWILRAGAITAVGVQPELNACTGRELRARVGDPDLVIATMCNGGAKYLPDAESFDRATYEAQSSRFARGGAELLVDAVAAELNA